MVQGKVSIRRDAGQVVAGDAVTHIQTYNAHASRSLLAVAFFFGITTALAGAAALPMPIWGGYQVCLYDGRHYSPGALAIMGRVEMVCTTDSGAPRWSRSEPTALDEGEH